MSNTKSKKNITMMLAVLGLLTAIIVVLQSLAIGIRFGTFSITLTLVPIVVGAALYGWKAGAWLGFVFGVVVLLTDAGAFLAVNVPGTIITCILKGAAAGAAAGFVYNLMMKKFRNSLVSVVSAGIVSPVVNTGLFLLGCVIFFLPTITEWAGGSDVGAYMLTSFVGLNFLVELGINLALSSVIVVIINIGKKSISNKH